MCASPKVHVALAADERYLPGLEVTRATMLRSCAHPERLELHVFRETPEMEVRIRREFGEWKGSVMAFVRLYLPELLPGVDWVIYSDVDTIWNRDVCELYDFVLSQDASPMLYWVKELRTTREDAERRLKHVAPDFDRDRYACSGIAVLNLKKMRETDFLQRAVDFTREHGIFRYPDQDLLNVLCNKDSRLLPSYWGVLGNLEELPKDSRCVYHVTSADQHFHAKTPAVYPPQYQFWWNVRTGSRNIHPRSRLLARLWPVRFLTVLLPYAVRERVVRQMFFARELQKMAKGKLCYNSSDVQN